jgi:hypothetical protein
MRLIVTFGNDESCKVCETVLSLVRSLVTPPGNNPSLKWVPLISAWHCQGHPVVGQGGGITQILPITSSHCRSKYLVIAKNTHVLPEPKRGTKNSNNVTWQACHKRRLRRVRIGRQSNTMKTCHSRLMGNILPWSLLFVLHLCCPHWCSGEVAQRTLHLCYLCDRFPQVAGNAGSAITVVLATKSDVRMMILYWPAPTCYTTDRTWQSWDFGILSWLSAGV